MNRNTLRQLLRRVDVRGPDDCWPWKGSLDRDGYGINFRYRGKARRPHRVVFFAVHGRWPEPYCLHSCDNPPCCNPKHLHEGDAADNANECLSRARTTRGNRNGSRLHPERVPRGEAHAHAKLTDARVRWARAQGGVSILSLANRFGVSWQTMADAIRRSTWRHVA